MTASPTRLVTRLHDRYVLRDREMTDATKAMQTVLDIVYGSLDVLGEENRSHLTDTAARFVRSLVAMSSPEPFSFTVFDRDFPDVNEGDFGDTGMVVVQDIPFVSLCAHHLAPFEGVGHIAYIPRQKVVGLSKLPRTLNYFAAGLQIQERLGQQVADELMSRLDPIGVAVILRATHTCMTVRGVKAHGSITKTSCLRGDFYTNESTRQELFHLLNLPA